MNMNSPLSAPIRNISNNGVLYGQKAMPQKDINSNGDTFFSQTREQYVRTYSAQNTTATINSKKWYGSSRDSSASIIAKTNAINANAVSLNSTGQAIGFSTHNDINTTRDALRRVRSQGYVVPPKVRNAQNTTSITPSWQSGPLVRTENRASVRVWGIPTNGQYQVFREKPTITIIPPLTDTGMANRVRHQTGVIPQTNTPYYH